jgi:hypothetical protein
MASGEQLTLPLEGGLSLRESSLSASNRGLRGPQRTEFVLRIEPGQFLSRLDAIAYIHQTIDQSSSDTKTK